MIRIEIRITDTHTYASEGIADRKRDDDEKKYVKVVPFHLRFFRLTRTTRWLHDVQVMMCIWVPRGIPVDTLRPVQKEH